ncbi:lysine-specific demethylase 7B-like isoform X2 [Dendronephthya gigantea]|uniref:lysine-specific demethylase 7B-like isoform X2 n=1 Tax=Dendronephthya gigantea TaxID=151771 RepID=UPI0010695A89|nr:lysine-specific demethylase 7B-like isoform X2 [Dendronephthya gigantea]
MASDLYCICRKPYDYLQFMIQCDVCDDWFHGSCVGIEEYQANDIERYHCPRCAPRNGPLTLKKQQNLHRHDYSDDNAHCKAVQAGTVVFIKQLKNKQFSSPENILLKCQGKELTLDYLAKKGYRKPILVESKDGLGLVVPKPTFSIRDVQQYIGANFELDIIDVARQGDVKMKMCDWTAYFISTKRQKTLNVISLEFSRTSLSQLVHAPRVVREVDWVNRFWPEHGDGVDESPTHPKPYVQKYCLMGVKDSYTDFHVDFGGSSVWYHVLWGEKVFYFAEPTETNLNLYEKWTASSNQSEMFFADLITRCYRVHVKAGQTLFIPSGWIHAVYTSEDSLVFGGNFLHSYNIGLQLNVYDMELRLKTPTKYLFSSFETVHWYAAAGLIDELKNLDDSGEKKPQFLIEGIHILLNKLRSWVTKKDGSFDKHKMFLPEGMDYNKVIKSLSKELKQAEKPCVVVHEQKPVIKIKKPTPKTTASKKPESRKKSEKNESRNQKKSVEKTAEKAPLKLKISKNKETELSRKKSPENLKLVVSNGKIVSGSRKKQTSSAHEVVKDSKDDEQSTNSSYSCQQSQEQPLRLTLSANGREESDDDVNVDDLYPSFPPANGLPIQQQLQALYSSRGQTTASTSKTTTSTRHHPPVSISMPRYSSDEQSPEKYTSVENGRRRSRLNSPAEDEEDILNKFPSDPDYVYPTIEDDETPGKVKWKPGMKKKKSERVDATWNPKGRVPHSPVTSTSRPVRQISRKPDYEMNSSTNNNINELKSPRTSSESEGSSSKQGRAPLRPSGAGNQAEGDKGNSSKRGRRPVQLTTKQRLAKKLKLDKGGMFMR